MTIKGIIFDLGYTLITPLTNDWVLTESFFSFIPKETLHKQDPKKAFESFSNAYQKLKDDHVCHDTDKELKQWTQFYYDFVNGMEGLSLSMEDAYIIAKDHTYNPDQFVLCEDTIETLTKLKQQGYKLGLLSDTWPSAVNFIKELGIYDFFDMRTYSFEEGKFKPDPEIFDTAIKRMELEPDEMLFVDDLLRNLIMAENFGMHPVMSLLNPKTKENERYESITSPSDIFDVIKHYDSLN